MTMNHAISQDKPQNAPTQELPELTSDYALSTESIARFRSDGHVLLRGLCSSDEVNAYAPAIAAAAFETIDEQRPLEQRDAYGRAFLQTLNLRYVSPAVAKFVLARRFAKAAAQLLGVRAVRIFHEQALFKEPGGGRTPWHQDQYYWPLETPNTIGLWMPLVDVSIGSGALMHASGSHRDGMLGQFAISNRSDEVFTAHITKMQYPISVQAMSAGDATFHYGWTLHSAPPNSSASMRKAMVVTYFEDGARVAVPKNSHQENDRVKFLGGIAAGQLANGPMNPVVYSEG